MQAPSLGLMSLFGIEPSLLTSGGEALTEQGEGEFSSLFNLLVGNQEVATTAQQLPLMLQQLAAKAESLPFAEPATSEADVVNSDDAEATELGLLTSLLAQMNIGELQQVAAKPQSKLTSAELNDTDAEDEPLLVAAAPLNNLAILASQQQNSTSDETEVSDVLAAPKNSAIKTDLAATKPGAQSGKQGDSAAPKLDTQTLELESGAEEKHFLHAKAPTTTKELEIAPAATQVAEANTAADKVATNTAVSVITAATSSKEAATPAPAQVVLTAAEQELQQKQLQQAQKLELGNDTKQWGGALASRIVTMVADDVQHARIHLDPPELGSLEVKMQIQNQHAVVHIQAQHGQVRDVLEAQAHRLRESLAEHGLELSEFDVSAQSQQQSEGRQQQYAQTEQQGSELASYSTEEGWAGADGGSLTPSQRASTQSMTLLDTYA